MGSSTSGKSCLAPYRHRTATGPTGTLSPPLQEGFLGSIEQWLPNAIQATTAVGQLILGVATHRTEQAEDWGNRVEEITGVEPDALRRAVEVDLSLAELLWRSLDAAAETASDDKRHLLAQVAAAALRGDTTPERIDRLQFLMRPVLALSW